MIRVRKSIRKWIAKNRLSFFERDAVLNKITRCFLLVPCKAHGGTIAALSLFLPLNQRPLELYELIWIMCQVKFLFGGIESNSPLLHSQGAKQDFDRIAVFIFADLLDHQRIGRNRVALDFSVEHSLCIRLLNTATERRSNSPRSG